ncbi:MAG: RNA methyltransferase [Candidatus Gracilibacteria bacterium]|nr:RNA methyltransferase [Candidatus Gracilibacteria bacterium]
MSHERYLLLDNLRSLQNVGALFRTADGAGFSKIYLTGITPTPPRKEISKTALGAELSVPWEWYENPIEILTLLRENSVQIIGLEQSPRSIPYTELILNSKASCLILGNEISGVSQSLLQFSDTIIEIPMLGIKQSLNVGTAGGICMYHLLELAPK